MSKIIAAKVNALPSAGNRSADTMYFVKSADPEYIDLYMTSLNASETRRIINKSDISTLIANAVANALFKESGVATPRTLQEVFNIDTLYRSWKQSVELFASGYNIQVSADIAVVSGTTGNDFIDILDTSTIIVNQDYLLTNGTTTVIIRPISVLSSTRIQLSASLANNWDNTAKVTGSMLTPNVAGGADAAIGDQWISKKVNLGSDDGKRVVVIRRTANTGVVRLYFRDSFTTSWTEVTRSVRITGNDVNRVPSGYYDDKYLVSLKGDGYLRIATETAAMTIKHIAALAFDNFSIRDFLGDDGVITAFQTAINATPNSGIQVIEVPDGSYSGDLSTLTFGARKIVWSESNNVVYPDTAPFGIRYNKVPRSCSSLVDLVGMAGSYPDQQIHVPSVYKYNAIVTKPKGNRYFLWDPLKAKSAHDGVTVISPTVPWNGTAAGFNAYFNKTGETNVGGSGCWISLHNRLTVEMAGAVGDKTTNDRLSFQICNNILAAQGGGTFYFSGQYLIDTSLNLTDFVSCVGSISAAGELLPAASASYDSMASLLIVNSTATISVGDGCALTNGLIMRKGLDLPYVDLAAATAGVAAFAGTAVTVIGADAFLSQLMVLGFARAVDSSSAERGRFEYIIGDCTNGIRVQNCLDVSHINNCHFWPYTTVHQSWTTNDLLVRTGTAYEYSNTADWCKMTDCFAFGYEISFDINNVNSAQLSGCSADYASALTVTTPIGFYIRGDSRKIVLDRPQAAGRAKGIVVDSTADTELVAEIISPSCWTNDVGHIIILNGRTSIRGGSMMSATNGIVIDPNSDGADIDGVTFYAVTNPITGSGAGWNLTRIGTNYYKDCNDAVGKRTIINSPQSVNDSKIVFNNTPSPYTLIGAFARGTAEVPAATLATDAAFKLLAQVYDGTAFRNTSMIRMGSSGSAATSTSSPGNCILSTTASGAISPVDRVVLDHAGQFTPATDNVYPLGKNGVRWTELWAANGTIQTSDQREKTNIQNSSLGLDFINQLRPVSYQWISGGKEVIRQVYLDKDGNEIPEGQPIPDDATPGEIITIDKPGTRTHWGLIAQEVKATCDGFSVDFGGWVLSDFNNPDSQQALRYDQFISPLIKAVQELSAQVDSLKQQLAALQSANNS